MYKAKTID